MNMEINHDTVRSMSDAELADKDADVTHQINNLYAFKDVLEAEIRARMDDQGTTSLKSEGWQVTLSPQKGKPMSMRDEIGFYESLEKFVGKEKQKLEYNSKPAFKLSKRNKGKGAS